MTSSVDAAAEPKARKRFHALLEERFDALFAAQAAGFDCPPAQRYRLEGMLETGLALGWLDAEQLPAWLAERGQAHAISCLDLRVDADGHVSLRAVSPRAPVHPTTDR